MSNTVVPKLPVSERARALSIEPAVVLVPAGLLIAVVATAAPSGSYFPSSWGWASLAFLWAAAIGLVAQRRLTFGTLHVAYLGAWLALLVWTAASLLWSPTTTQTMYEVERTVVYVSFAVALAVLARRSLQLVLPALLAGIVAVAAYALATRLLPDRVGSFDSYVGYRLSEPLGYWNALSVFVAVGIAVAIGLAARGQVLVVRALSAASLVLLLPVLYFTFGRGGWIALASGLAVAIAVDPRRLQLVTTLLVIVPWLDERSIQLPLMASVTFIQAGSQRGFSGQTVEGFWNSISHVPLLSVGMNCALGPKEMRPLLEELAHIAPIYVSSHPNAGLPNPLLPTGFPETPESLAPQLANGRKTDG